MLDVSEKVLEGGGDKVAKHAQQTIKVRPEDVYHEGITMLTPADFRYARELGYAINFQF